MVQVVDVGPIWQENYFHHKLMWLWIKKMGLNLSITHKNHLITDISNWIFVCVCVCVCAVFIQVFSLEYSV